jgi:hypothetical protein
MEPDSFLFCITAHEAGHVVVQLHYRWRLHEVSLIPDDEGKSEAAVKASPKLRCLYTVINGTFYPKPWVPWRMALHPALQILMGGTAGVLADERARYDGEFVDDDARNDYEVGCKLLQRAGVPKARCLGILRQHREEALNIIESHGSAHRRLTDHLLDRYWLRAIVPGSEIACFIGAEIRPRRWFART